MHISLIFVLQFAAGPLPIKSAAPNETLNALFARKSGWIGADGNYSVALSNTTTLWFFSDTWIGTIENGRRKNAKLINNSIGIQTKTVDYHWGGSEQKPAAFFTPPDGIGWFWPFAGVFVKGRVQLLLMQMEKAPGSEAFGFRNAGVWLATIENPAEPPKTWTTTYAKVPHTQIDDVQRLLFGASMMMIDDEYYIYGALERPKIKGFGRRMVVARTRTLDDFKSWQFYDGREWTDDLLMLAPGPEVAAEYSVVPLRDRFVLVTHEAMLGPRIVARTADQPWGPWSEAVELYRCPEAKTRGVFCYSGKAHAGFTNKNELLLTYSANAFKMADVLNDAQLYWPKFLTVKLK